MQKTNCCLCGSDDSVHLLTVRDEAYGGPGEFPWVRCVNCGLIYVRQRPSPEEIMRYYPPDYMPYRTAIEDERFALVRWARQRSIQKRRKVVEQATMQTKGCILDVGCATGIFLNEMRRAGWEGFGVEPNPAAAAYARSRFGLQVHEGQLRDSGFPQASMDAITFWDVLEHTFDPLQTLQEARLILREGGFVVVTLPHWESLDRLLFGTQWNGFDAPRHLALFPRPVLLRLLGAAGFQLRRMWCSLGGYYTFLASAGRWLDTSLSAGHLRELVKWVLYSPGARLPFAPYFYAVDLVARGGTLVVVATK